MFNVADEDAAFAYAEERAKAKTTRLPLTNRASDVALRVTAALSHGDPDAFVAAYHPGLGPRRSTATGAPIGSRADMRVSVVRMLQQFNHWSGERWRFAAQRLAMGQSRSSDSDGNVSTYLRVRRRRRRTHHPMRPFRRGRLRLGVPGTRPPVLRRRGRRLRRHGPKLQAAFMDAVNRRPGCREEGIVCRRCASCRLPRRSPRRSVLLRTSSAGWATGSSSRPRSGIGCRRCAGCRRVV